jgi:hypothetical protein
MNVPNFVMAAVILLPRSSLRAPIALGAVCILLFSSSLVVGQPPSISATLDPVELLRKSVQNEVKSANDDSTRFLFRGIKTTPKGSTTRIYVETKDATAGMVVAYNGNPLTSEQRRDEEARFGRFATNPEELRKKRQQEKENAENSLRITRALPEAFLYEYAGEEQGSPGMGRPGSTLVKLKFQPNPKYEPPSRVEEILTGMQGYILLDPVHHRIASIDGTFFKEVGFGWGILGHLDRGGRFFVQQQQVDDNLWEISSMTLNFTGRILMFKSLNINSTEVFSGFKRVPSDISFAQALELLKKEQGN